MPAVIPPNGRNTMPDGRLACWDIPRASPNTLPTRAVVQIFRQLPSGFLILEETHTIEVDVVGYIQHGFMSPAEYAALKGIQPPPPWLNNFYVDDPG